MKDNSSHRLDKRAAAYEILAVPVIAQEEAIRWFTIRKPADYNELDEELLEVIASYISSKLAEKSQ